MKTSYVRALLHFLLCAVPASVFAQGSLTPPAGTPQPTMKTLDQIEPHTAITSLPITISNPGSYYLTGNLTAKADGAAITVSANNVTIDLNRFTLSGGGTGNRTGIQVSAAQKNLCVRNGTLTGFGSGVIMAANSPGAVYEDLRVTDNVAAQSAILAGDGALVHRCVVTGNGASGSTGILLGKNGSVIECIVSSNTGTGIHTGANGNIVNTTASGNTAFGIAAGSNNTVAHCTASGNGSEGILAVAGTTVTDCTASGNDIGIDSGDGSTISRCSVSQNVRSGLTLTNYCQVTGCTVTTNNTSSTNLNAGLRIFGTGNRIDSNHFANNNFAGLTAQGVSGNTIIRNTFYGAQSIVDPGNITGPAVIMSSGGTITSTNPWANIYY